MPASMTLCFDAESHGTFRIGESIEGSLSLCAAGDMRQPHSRQRFVDRLGLCGRVVSVIQVHSRRVVAAADARSQMIEADGLFSDAPGDALLVTVADCLPIYLAGPDGAMALVHSGWRGTGIVLDALQLLRTRYGIATASVTAVIGPGIGACCYHVDEERAALFHSRYGAAAVRWQKGRPHLDLRQVNEHLLRQAGVANVRSIDLCTSCTPELWSSRRDGGGPACPLMAAVIRRVPQ